MIKEFLLLDTFNGTPILNLPVYDKPTCDIIDNFILNSINHGAKYIEADYSDPDFGVSYKEK